VAFWWGPFLGPLRRVSSGAEPFSRRLAVYLRLSICLALLFTVTYTATNRLSALRTNHLRLYFDRELNIPFVPWMIWVYLSINFFLALPLAVLNIAEIHRFARAFALATIAAALTHLLLPTQLGWAQPACFTFDYPHNLAPSLHVAYAVLAGAAVWHGASSFWVRMFSGAWLALLVSSVVLVHQHHLLDVVTGAALGILCYRWFSR
jgi:membrane-associated phospholipid phosphatase